MHENSQSHILKYILYTNKAIFKNSCLKIYQKFKYLFKNLSKVYIKKKKKLVHVQGSDTWI